MTLLESDLHLPFREADIIQFPRAEQSETDVHFEDAPQPEKSLARMAGRTVLVDTAGLTYMEGLGFTPEETAAELIRKYDIDEAQANALEGYRHGSATASKRAEALYSDETSYDFWKLIFKATR